MWCFVDKGAALFPVMYKCNVPDILEVIFENKITVPEYIWIIYFSLWARLQNWSQNHNEVNKKAAILHCDWDLILQSNI